MPDRKKILHLITRLEIGGAEMMLLKVLPRLRDSFDNRVCCIRGRGPMAERLETAGVPVTFLDLNHPFDIGAVFRFRAIIREFQPDVLVTYLIHADLFGRIFGRLFGIRKIACNQRGKLLQWEFLRIIDRATRFLVTKYIVQTEIAKRELMKKLGLPKERFEVITNAIDFEEFDFEIDTNKKREDLGLKPTDTVITCVSKLRRGKGHEYLLEAFESLFCHSREGGNPVKLLIVGDGERKEELLDQARNYASKSDILFLGSRDDVKEILKITDIFALPTLGEGMSNAIMEAMATGLPVITTDIPENCELIEHEKTGILVPPKNSRALAEAIEQLLADPEKRKTLGENAKRDIREQFGISVVISKLNQFFNGL